MMDVNPIRSMVLTGELDIQVAQALVVWKGGVSGWQEHPRALTVLDYRLGVERAFQVVLVTQGTDHTSPIWRWKTRLVSR
jgi:hypothetical protein